MHTRTRLAQPANRVVLTIAACSAFFALLTIRALGVEQKGGPESLATLDLFISGPDGPVTGPLTPADIELKIDGRVRAVRQLELIEPPDAKASTISAPGQPPTGTQRYIVLLIDEPTLFGLEPIVKDAVRALLASLVPRDLVAFYSTRGGDRRTALTPRHETVRAYVDSMITGPGVLWSCQRELMQMVEGLAPELPPGRSTTIAVLSRGHPSGGSFAGDSESGPCAPRREHLRKLEETIAVAQINFHLLTVDETSRSWGLDTIAGNTGGTKALLTWSDAGALERSVRATARFYRASFVWGPGDSRTHRVEVRATNPAYKVRTSPVLRAR